MDVAIASNTWVRADSLQQRLVDSDTEGSTADDDFVAPNRNIAGVLE